MGWLARLLSFTRESRNGAAVSDVKVDTGGDETATVDHFQSAGDDAHPLPGDYAALIGAAGEGRKTAVAYLDPKNEQKAAAGERRVYARNSSGAQVAEMWLKNDGTIVLDNTTGSITLAPDGTITTANALVSTTLAPDGSALTTNGVGVIQLMAAGTINLNGVIITPAGQLTAPVSVAAPSVIVDNKPLETHTHPAGTPPGNTGPIN